MLSNKEIYRQICERETIPLMAQYKWMEAVSYGKEWDVIIVWIDDNRPHCIDNVAAALPCHLLRKFGVRFMLMPQLTQFTSIYYNPSVEPSEITPLVVKNLDRYLRENRISCCLIQGYFDNGFIAAANIHGYSVSERYSYRIENKSEWDAIVSAFDNNRRRNLNKAKELKLSSIGIEEFYFFHKNSLAERGLDISYQYELLHQIKDALDSTSQIEVYGAKDISGNLLAATVMVSDAGVAYYLLPVYSSSSKNSGAMTWLTTKLILLVNGRGLIFDFEGSMVPSIAMAYKSYGSSPATYFRIEKYRSRIVRLLLCFRTKLKRNKL